MTEKFLNALRNYIDEVAENAKYNAVNIARDVDEDDNYRKIERAWEEVLWVNNNEDDGEILDLRSCY